GVIAWAAASLAFPNADLTVQAMSEFLKEINTTSRFAGLTLGGDEGSPTAGSVCAWQSGFPLRVSFANGKPEYDSERYDMMRMLAAKESDLLLWLASFTPDLSPPDTDVPMIVLGTPGINHAGIIIRVDTVVSLPLRKLRKSKLPRAADVIASIEAAL